MWLIGLGVIVAVTAYLIIGGDQEEIAGLSPDQFASLVGLLVLGLFITGGLLPRYRGRWSEAFRTMVFWAAMMVMLVAVYSYRDEFNAIGARLMSELSPGTTETAEGGEVIVNRRRNGDFIINGEINGQSARFVFDTGASTVVLTPDTAMAAGLDPAKLAYNEAILTANGRATAAAVTIDRLTIGGLTERRVRALVARPGALFGNLLGMSFLNRLASYEVRRDRLIMRGREPQGRS